MSYHGSKYSSDDSRRHGSSRRDSDRDRHRRRSESPGPSRSRDRSDLPQSFGRAQENHSDRDDLDILERMKSSYSGGPLEFLRKSVSENKPIKVWTRNYKEVRGICSGHVLAFDKHWNLIMTVVDEVYLKPRRKKAPFLRDIEPNEEIPEMQPKVPRKKKTAEELAAIKAKEEEAAKQREENPSKPKRKKKKKGPTTNKRHMPKVFVRGDNIVMIAPASIEDDDEVEEDVTQAA